MWKPVEEIVAEFKKAEAAGANMAALAMGYICLDTMAFLAMPDNQTKQTRSDFISFVDTYLKAHEDQLYQYRGIEVYAARCAVLHRYSSLADMHAKDSTIKMFGYSTGGRHFYNPDVSDSLVIVGTASLLNDIAIAATEYMKACLADLSLRERAEKRLPNVLKWHPHP